MRSGDEDVRILELRPCRKREKGNEYRNKRSREGRNGETKVGIELKGKERSTVYPCSGGKRQGGKERR